MPMEPKVESIKVTQSVFEWNGKTVTININNVSKDDHELMWIPLGYLCPFLRVCNLCCTLASGGNSDGRSCNYPKYVGSK